MPMYARVENNVVVERKEIDPATVPASKLSRFWRVIQGEAPSYDPFLQRISGPTEIIEANRVLRQWVVTDIPRAELAALVKTEARRRILERYPDWRQVNMAARGVELQDLWRRNGAWTASETDEAEALQAAWSWVKLVRDASNAIEADATISSAYASDARWPA